MHDFWKEPLASTHKGSLILRQKTRNEIMKHPNIRCRLFKMLRATRYLHEWMKCATQAVSSEWICHTLDILLWFFEHCLLRCNCMNITKVFLSFILFPFFQLRMARSMRKKAFSIKLHCSFFLLLSVIVKKTCFYGMTLSLSSEGITWIKKVIFPIYFPPPLAL